MTGAWQESTHFHAGALEEIADSVVRRYPQGVVDAAWDSVTLPSGSGEAVLDLLAERVIRQSFTTCLEPSVVRGGLGAVVQRVAPRFAEGCLGLSDAQLDLLAADLAGANTAPPPRVEELYRQRLRHLQKVCETWRKDGAAYGLDVVFVRYGPDFEPLAGA